MSHLLSGLLKESELAIVAQIASAKRNLHGARFDTYIDKVIEVLKVKCPEVNKLTSPELRDVVAMVDVWGVESRGMMKMLTDTCTGCGWCCSQTSTVIVDLEDTERISRQLRKKRDELFVSDGKYWHIKRCCPCQWWNPRNGHCLIYHIRPSTCRWWPLQVNEYGQDTLHNATECNYSVMVLVYKVIGALQASEQVQ
ncbi:YkgJ family cysteine cluster protein [Dehalogenimonas etheniformans]|nr:YkgJ family cysteine cluster protein [Dehalogenimonas etheniformans]QNT76779.1 YkgJ family cysteine cluster protein [Dehalogenimonas etheniformans]